MLSVLNRVNTISILYETCVLSISEYESAVFGLEQFNISFQKQFRAARALSKNLRMVWNVG